MVAMATFMRSDWWNWTFLNGIYIERKFTKQQLQTPSRFEDMLWLRWRGTECPSSLDRVNVGYRDDRTTFKNLPICVNEHSKCVDSGSGHIAVPILPPSHLTIVSPRIRHLWLYLLILATCANLCVPVAEEKTELLTRVLTYFFFLNQPIDWKNFEGKLPDDNLSISGLLHKTSFKP